MMKNTFKKWFNEYFYDKQGNLKVNSLRISIPGTEISFEFEAALNSELMAIFQTYYDSLKENKDYTLKEETEMIPLNIEELTKGKITYIIEHYKDDDFTVIRKDNGKLLKNSSPVTKGIIKSYLTKIANHE